MPFFIKGKRKRKEPVPLVNGNSNLKKGKSKFKTQESDEEISSDFEDEVSQAKHQYKYSSDEDALETVQEKRLRLANKYLEEIAKEEKKRLECDEVDKDTIGARLKEEVLEQAGRLRKSIAPLVIGVSEPCILRCKDHSRSITCLVVSPKSNFIFSASDDFNIVKWSLSDMKKVQVIKRTHEKGHKRKILAMAICSDEQFFVTGDAAARIEVWNPSDLSHIRTFAGHKINVSGLAFRRDTHQLFSSSSDKTVKIWNLDEMMYVETLYGHQCGIVSLDALTRDRAITAGGRDNTVRVWKVVEESHLVFNGFKEVLDCVRFLDDDHFVTGGEDGCVCLWSCIKKKPLCSVADAHGPDSWVISVAACPYTDLFATGSHTGAILVYKVEAKQKSFSKLLSVELDGNINALAFTPDGKTLIAGVGREHRLGRWTTVKSAINSVVIIKLNTSENKT